MTQPYGIDTSVLVRLVTADPEPDFERCVNELRALIEEQDAEVFASNQVVGEAYIVLQHHYGISASDARSALADTLTSGIGTPLNGAVRRAGAANVRRPRSFRQADRGRILTRGTRDAYARQTDGKPSQRTQAVSRE